MAKKSKEEELSDQDAELRAFNALRRALATPYKPQSDLKIGRKGRKKPATEKPKRRTSHN